MGMSGTFNNIVEEKLLNLHTAFIGKIIKMEGETLCTVQPLDKIKAYGQQAKQQAVITKVPILNHVRHYSLVKQSLSVSVSDTYTGGGSENITESASCGIECRTFEGRAFESRGHRTLRMCRA